MGWNIGFSIMEHTVITLYNKNVLTKELLEEIMEPYKGTDCDSGGSKNLISNDGLCVEHIICKVMKPNETLDIENNPIYWEDFEENKDCYMEKVDFLWKANKRASDLFYSIWSDIWGIW